MSEIETLLLDLNVIFTLILVSIWVSYILWKGILKEVITQLEEAIETNHRIMQRTFEVQNGKLD